MSADNQPEDTVDGFLGLKGKGHYCPRDLEIQDWGPGGPSEAPCDSTDSHDILSILMRETNPSLWRDGLREMLKVDRKLQLTVIDFLKNFTRQSILALERGLDVRIDVNFGDIIVEQVVYTHVEHIFHGLNLQTSIAESGNTRQLDVRTGMKTTLISLGAFQSLLESISELQFETLSMLLTLECSEGLKLYQSHCSSYKSQEEAFRTLDATFPDLNSDDCKTVIKCFFGTVDTLVTDI